MKTKMKIGPIRNAIIATAFALLVTLISTLWFGVKPFAIPVPKPVGVPHTTPVIPTPNSAPNDALNGTSTVPVKQINGDYETQDVTTTGTKSLLVNESLKILGGYSLTPVKIIEDSRCKQNVQQNVQCVWAGRLVVAVRIDSKITEPKTRNVEITLGQGMVLNGYDITLVDYLSDRFIFKVEGVQKNKK